jgi:tRNA-2-methylthio-N6-dimethylallyladenosine synthase
LPQEFWIPLLAKKVFIKSYGCQMNVYDSARMADVLVPVGYEPTENPDSADLVILNTCHIREKAAEKVYSELGRIRSRAAKSTADTPKPQLLAVAGCVAQAEGEEILRRAPNVDFVVGPQSYHNLPDLVAQATRRSETAGRSKPPGIVETEFPTDSKFNHLPAPVAQGPSAFLTIQEGCDKFCAFCVVPYTRGAEYSRPVADVMKEARQLIEGGAREITLLGQNVNAYHGVGGGAEDGGLAGLIRSLAEIDGLARIRYTTSHPRDMNEALIRAHAEIPALMPYLHLPVQSGSDLILSRMNRRHSAADYLAVIEELRRANPDMALSSDFIVGHPGETEQAFEQTLDLIREVGFAQAYSFKYSPRPGTPAADAEDQVSETDKSERLERLQNLLNEQQLSFNHQSVGKTVSVLFDRRGKHSHQIAGRSPHMQAVHLDCTDPTEAASLFGTISEVKIVSAHANSLKARLVAAKPMLSTPAIREPATA